MGGMLHYDFCFPKAPHSCEAGVKRRNILLALERGFAAGGILTGEHSLEIAISTQSSAPAPPDTGLRHR
jgi:hypothetical protein